MKSTKSSAGPGTVTLPRRLYTSGTEDKQNGSRHKSSVGNLMSENYDEEIYGEGGNV